MKIKFLVAISLLMSVVSYGQTDSLAMYIDSLENSLTYHEGNVELLNGIGVLTIPDGFKYLDAEQSEYVLTELWGNPQEEDMTLGMLLPVDQGVLSDSSWVFNIEYEEIGYVEDEDASDIDYDDLLEDLQEETEEGNAQREELGYETISLVGWASKPYYDENKKILHWAKELNFGGSEENTLNYNIRILGRKGVLVINAISSMNVLPGVKNDVPEILASFEFSEDNKYENYDPGMDKVAAYTVGGLVAGKVLAKTGIFVGLLKFWKVIAIAVAGFFGTFWKRLKGKE
ncbi:DUF2167 domain-containing protein [Marinilabiliaceae bacterium JC017]|nr:DUF2167 domain-containing protein [Marinilabiliaceae bacterium JC017]